MSLPDDEEKMRKRFEEDPERVRKELAKGIYQGERKGFYQLLLDEYDKQHDIDYKKEILNLAKEANKIAEKANEKASEANKIARDANKKSAEANKISRCNNYTAWIGAVAAWIPTIVELYRHGMNISHS